MRRLFSNDPLALDDATVERLLSGTLPPAGAPPGYAGVARLLAATVAPPTPRELAGQAAVLAELRAVTRRRRAATAARPARRPRRRRAGLAVVVVVGALTTGGVAAATGHLPGPVRDAARSVLGPADGQPATLPSPASAAAPATGTVGSGATGSGGTAATAGSGPRPGPAAAGPAAGPALDGLCRAFQAQGGRLDPPAFADLAAAAGGPGKVEAFCEDRLAAAKTKPPKEPKPKPPPDDPEQGQGQSGPPPSTGGSGGTGAGGSGLDQGSPPAGPSASNTPAKNDGRVTR